MTKPWDRRPAESNPASTAFVAYRDMGPERSLAATTKALGKPSGYTRQLETWSSQHDWVKRVRAYDAWLDQEVQARVLRAAGDRAMQQVKLGQKLRKKAEARLDSLEDEDLDGQDVARLAKVGVEIERLAMGEPTEIQQNTFATETSSRLRKLFGDDPDEAPEK